MMVAALVSALVLSSSATAGATPPLRRRTESAAAYIARRLTAAQSAEARRDWETALAEYEAALATGPSRPASEGLARVHFELGHDGEAFEAYTLLASSLSEAAATRARVAERLKLLGSRVGVVVLTVTTPDADVYIDGKRVGHSPLQQLALHVSAGKHVVRAVSSSAPTEQRDIDMAPGAVVQVRLPEEPKAESTGEPAAAPVAAPVGPPPAPAPAPALASGQEDGEPWQVAHGSRSYKPARAATRPVIDGTLSEQVWKDAPVDTTFFSLRSKPYGRPTAEPTSVQVAYDEENLYVAVRCAYSSKRARDNAFTIDEEGLLSEAESFAVVVDPLHTHSNAFLFAVARVGTRADVELTEGGTNSNPDWRGIWDVATQRTADAWTAEFRIPWGTMRMPAQRGPVDVGIGFRRREPISGELALWALHPPATESFDTNFLGHLEGLIDLRPSQRLYLQPYVAAGYDDRASTSASFLDDMTSTRGQFRAFAGLYVRYQPPAPIRVDATFNPNFTGVTPDRALANLDRFELAYPEVRPFFAEDVQRFQFGGKVYPLADDPGTQLFYSRRIGLRTDTSGLTEVVPIIYGVKSVLRSGGTEAAVMNVGLAPNRPRLSLQDSVSVGRVSQTFDEGRRIGVIGLGRFDENGQYLAGGVDGTLTLLDRHVAVTGFLAQTKSDQHRRSGAGQLSLDLTAQDFHARMTHADIGTAFDAQLGFVPLTGVRSDTIAGGYTPVVRNDLIQRFYFEGQLTLARDRSDARVYDRGAINATIETPELAYLDVAVLPAIEQVASDFRLANERVLVTAGRYETMVLRMTAGTAPRLPVVASVRYQAGDLFAGTLRSPSFTLGLNLGRFTSTTLYRLFLVHYGDTSLVEHQVSATAGFSYTPLAKSTLVIESNTLAGRALAQFLTSYTFGALSTVSLVLRATSGSTVQQIAEDWFDRPGYSGIVSFAYGLTPF